MATKETRRQRAQRKGRELVRRLLHEIRDARLTARLSQADVASAMSWSQAGYARFEGAQLKDLGVIDLSMAAGVLGYEVSVGLHPIGDSLRDKGQLAVGKRFASLLSDAWRVTDETLLPGAGEQRAWDKLMRLIGASPRYLVGVDIETKVWDVQALVRRTRGRERDGHADHILVVLADTAHNRRVVDELRGALGGAYMTPARTIMRALRLGQLLVGSGVVLV